MPRLSLSLSLSFSLYSSNTILHYSFCSLLHTLSYIVEVLVTAASRSLLFVLFYGPLRLVLVLHLLLLLVIEGYTGGDVLVRVALILLDEAWIQEYHAFVHDFQVRCHKIEVA